MGIHDILASTCLPPFFRAYIFATLDPHAIEFKANYDESYERQYGFFRSVVDNVVHDYLKFGDLKEGFARVRYTNTDCWNEYLLAFSYKVRWFRPSYHSKKVIKFGEDVCNNILYPVPHRQFVFSIPILLRVCFKYDRELLTEFCRCARVGPDKKLIELHNPQVNYVTENLNGFQIP